MNKKLFIFFCFLIYHYTMIYSQTSFPSVTWSGAQNISSVLPTKSYELSGLYWNDVKKQLFIIADVGNLYVLNLNELTSAFTLAANISNIDGPEGITQVDNTTNEFYTVDENNYEIRKYALSANYSSLTLKNSWNLLLSPSPMTNTDNTGPEGITFIPDWFLKRIGFISSATGKTYQSSKGMNGLIFIAHQNGGYVWVFDVNPAVSNDFLYVGKYKTNEDESCDLAFDNSTGLLYILHNTSSNYVEVTDLTTSLSGGEYKFNLIKEYFVPNPTSGSKNVEGFALTPKYSNNKQISAWFCRDVSSSSESADCLRWFYPFNSEGENIITSGIEHLTEKSTFLVTTKNKQIKIQNNRFDFDKVNIRITSTLGQTIFKNNITLPATLNLNSEGVYYISITKNGNILETIKILIR